MHNIAIVYTSQFDPFIEHVTIFMYTVGVCEEESFFSGDSELVCCCLIVKYSGV
jgi:hypothetical protein